MNELEKTLSILYSACRTIALPADQHEALKKHYEQAAEYIKEFLKKNEGHTS